MPFKDGREAALQAHIKSLDQSTLRNNPTAVLAAIDAFVKDHPMMIFQPSKVEAARQGLSKLNPKPKVLVELGGFVGKSALTWGDMLRSFHSDDGAEEQVKVFSLELEPEFVAMIRDFVSIAGLEGTVEVMQGKSTDSLRLLKEERGIESIDVLFLDHWEKFYLPDLKVCEELGLLKVGSVVVADNVDMPGAPEYLKYVEAGGEGGWKYRCETTMVEGPHNTPRAVHFAFVEATP